MITVETGLPKGMEFDWQGNPRYQKSFYQVFECHSDGMFDYDESKVLFEHDNLAWAHSYAYDEWKKDNTKRYTIIQPYDGSCRGGYGFPEDEE